jgi:gliding motility-associated-like protein
VPITGADTIIIYGVQAILAASTTTLCDSGIVRFTDNSVSSDLITSYSWNFGDASISNQQHPVYSYKKSGSYSPKLIVTTQTGCKDSTIIAEQIKVINSPKIAMAATEGACIPATLNFSARVLVTDTSALTWNWNFGNGNISSLQNPVPQIYTLANSYTVRLTAVNSSGCITIADKPVQAYPLPDLSTNSDSYICKGQSINLSVTGAASYSWTPAAKLSCANCANPVAKPDSATRYVVKGTSVNSCIAFDSVLISVKYPVRLQVSKADTLCEGSSTTVSASGTDTYTWSPLTGLNNVALAQPTASPSVTTNYRVIGTDDKGCFKDTGYVLIRVFPVPTVNAGEDKTINVGQTLELIPTVSSDATKVVWSPTSGIFRNSYPGISIKPTESTEYTVEVSNAGSCMARDRVSVYVLCNNTNVFMPNTFSPNSDGTNDIFYPRGSGVFQIKVFRVFNRWGDVVFEKSNFSANDISAGWDGTYKGQKILPDVFVYTMNVVCDNNTILTFRGNIALIR